jgi:hypothetical protein
MILIKKKITAQDKEITFDVYLEKHFSVTIINNQQKILFLQDMVQSYLVDEKQHKLVVAPSSEEQLAQIKNLLGEVWLDEAYHTPSNYKQRSYNIANNFIMAPAKITGEVAVCVEDCLTPTVNHIQNTHESKGQFFELPLKENEMLSYMKTTIDLNGQSIVSTMELLSIEEVIMPEAFKELLNYTISAKAA